jgi:ABC-type glycerol-3-phosphate transport system substrate-binding protein
MDDWHNPTRLTLDEPLTVEAVEWYARLFYEHGVAPTTPQAIRAFGGRYNQEYYGITQGKAGMWMGVFSEREGLVWPAPWEFASGMVTLPREAVSSTFGGAEIYVISAKTEQPQAAWQWLSFLSKQLPNREAPARRSLLESDAFVQQVGEQAAATLRAALSSDSVRLSSGSGNRFLMERNFHGVFTEVVSRICAGEVTAREGLTAAQARLSGE